MKKLLLSAAATVLSLMATAQTTYVPGAAVKTADELTSGKYFIYAFSKNTGKFVHLTNFAGNHGLATIPEEGTSDASYIYTIDVDADKSFTIRASNGKYFPVKSSDSDSDGKGNVTTGLLADSKAADNVAKFAFSSVSLADVENTAYPIFYIEMKGVEGTYNNVKATPLIAMNGGAGTGHFTYWKGTTGVTGDSHETGLAFVKAELPANSYKTFNVDVNNGSAIYTFDADDNAIEVTSGKYGKYWMHSDENAGLFISVAANNMAFDADKNLLLYSGSSTNATYEIGFDHPGYAIAGISFDVIGDATSKDANPAVVLDGVSTSVSDVHKTTINYFPSTPAVYPIEFTISGSNSKLTTSNFKVYYTERTKEDYLADFNDEIDASLAGYINSSVYNKGAVKAANEIKEAIAAAINENAFNIDGAYAAQDEFYNIFNAKAVEIRKSAVGAMVQFNNIGRNGMKNYMGINAEKTELASNQGNLDLAKIWIIDSADEAGNVSLKNYLTGKYISSSNTNKANSTLVDTPDAAKGFFTIIPQTVNGIEVFDINTNATQGYTYLHDSGNNTVICWNTSTKDAASGWRMIDLVSDEASADIEVAVSKTEGSHVATISHADGINIHPDYHADHKLAVAPVDIRANGAEIAMNTVTVAENAATVNLGTLDAGEYELTIPAAMFTVGGAKFSKPVTYSFTIDENGNLTGIDEIGAAPAAKTIYDLQGRRVARATKGLYIINGVKTLVK